MDQRAPSGPEGPATRPATQPDPPRQPGVFRLGRVAGVPVQVTSSWFVVAAIIAMIVAPRVEQVSPGLGGFRYLAGAAFAVALYAAVLLHELSHAVVARHYGLPVSSITLHFLGGMTSVEGEARRPAHEFWIAVVGPLTSLAVGGGALGLSLVLPDGVLRLTVEGLAGANLVIGVLNLVPALPLDGGRVLRAGVWGATRNINLATSVSAWAGRVAAVLALALPVWLLMRGAQIDVVDLLFYALIAWFLWSGASSALAGAALRRRLPGLVAAELVRPAMTVPQELPLAEAVRRTQEAGARAIVTATHEGELVGVVNETALAATPDERRPWVPTSSVARSLHAGLRLPVGLRGEDLVRAITDQPSSEYVLVDEQGALVGVLSTADVDRAYRQMS